VDTVPTILYGCPPENSHTDGGYSYTLNNIQTNLSAFESRTPERVYGKDKRTGGRADGENI